MPANPNAEASADRVPTDECTPMMATTDPERELGAQILAIQSERRELDRRMRELIDEIKTRQRLLDELGRRNFELCERGRDLVDVKVVSPFVEGIL